MFNSGAKIRFIRMPEDKSHEGYKASCDTSKEDIRIWICPKNISAKIDRDICLAHEVTHGWLGRVEKYVRPVKTEDQEKDEQAGMIHNMVEDLVVYNRVKQEGFPIISPLDLKDIGGQAYEIEQNGQIKYLNMLPNGKSQSIIRVATYICCEYALKTIGITEDAKQVFERYFEAYKGRYLAEDGVDIV